MTSFLVGSFKFRRFERPVSVGKLTPAATRLKRENGLRTRPRRARHGRK